MAQSLTIPCIQPCTRLHSSVNHHTSKSTAYEMSSETLPLLLSHSSVITVSNLYFLIALARIKMHCCSDICSGRDVRIIEYKYPLKGGNTAVSVHSDTANHNSLSNLWCLLWNFTQCTRNKTHIHSVLHSVNTTQVVNWSEQNSLQVLFTLSPNYTWKVGGKLLDWCKKRFFTCN